MKNDKALSSATLELTQKIQLHFPRDIPPHVLESWNGCPKDVLYQRLQTAFGVSPQEFILKECINRLRTLGHLSRMAEEEEYRAIFVRHLSKEKTFDEYRKSGARPLVWDELERHMPFTPIENPGSIDVIPMKFKKEVVHDDEVEEAVSMMKFLGVRPLVYEELIQYGTKYPLHQEKKHLVALGSRFNADDGVRYPVLTCRDGFRFLGATDRCGTDCLALVTPTMVL